MHSLKQSLTILTCIGAIVVSTAWVGAQGEIPPTADLPATTEANLAAGLLLMVTPDSSAAMQQFDAALALVPDDPALYLQAAAAFADAEHQLRYLDRAIGQFPENGTLHLARGHALYSIYINDRQFERQLRYTDRQDALHGAALSYTAAQNLGAEGVADYANMVAWLMFGQAQGRLGNVQGALMAYRRHIALAELTGRFPPDAEAVAYVAAHVPVTGH